MDKKVLLIPVIFLMALGLSVLLWQLKFNTPTVKDELLENKLNKALTDFKSKYQPVAHLNYVGEAGVVQNKDIYFLTTQLLAPRTVLLKEPYVTTLADTTLFLFQQEENLLAHTKNFTIFWNYKDDIFYYAAGIAK